MPAPARPNARIIYVTGGARSGKSTFAERLATGLGSSQVTYLATAQALDDEMTARIGRHRADRPAAWVTLEEPLEVLSVLAATRGTATRGTATRGTATRGTATRGTATRGTATRGTVLLDCLSLWVSNLTLRGDSDEAILHAADELISVQLERGGVLIAVSNEVGAGIVPDNALARRYRDTLGWVNQRFALSSDEAWLLVSGLPLRLK